MNALRTTVKSVPRACSSRTHQPVPARLISTSPSPLTPWFVDPIRAQPPHLPPQPQPLPPPLPSVPSVPPPIHTLHRALSTTPLIDPTTLLVTRPLALPPAPPLPVKAPHGKRRRRGGTYSGEGLRGDQEGEGGIWSWWVMVQVKEGTEGRGAVESVVRIVRKALLTSQPPLPLPPNCKKRMHNGWAMIDAGDFAVHILSKDTREKYFSGDSEVGRK